MSDLLTPHAIERLAKSVGKTMAQVCREANVAPSTFSRWKAGKTEPTLDVYRRLRQAVAAPAIAAATVLPPAGVAA
jgi:transcriptional regulator with XRE-family HTH domain